ncbi:unnamed protein product [Candida verbasci]|uniref:Oligomycin resistance ATP-dependent permease YOR1 n=1 Tax=Candida verbasci TaxID=1227364 RepID=A0A9W4XJ58_9ASCO|nr:unnamed protein product [Candida verbasci]
MDIDDLSSLELNNEQYIPQKRLLSFLLKNKDYPIPKDDERKLYPEKNSNYIMRLFFWWLYPIMNVGYTRTLQPNDLWKLPDYMKVESYEEVFNVYLDLQMTKAKLNHIKRKCKERNETIESSSKTQEEDLQDFVLSMVDVGTIIFLTFKRSIIMSCIIACCCMSGWAVTPLLTKALVNYVERRSLGIEPNIGKGIGYSFGVALVMLATGLAFGHFFYIAQKVGVKAKSVLTNAILKKSFKLDAKGRHDFPSGKLTSMITTDLSRIEIALLFQPILIVLPVPIIVAIVILIVNIHVSAVIGIVLFFIFLVFLGFGSKKLFDYRDIVSKITDKRVSLIKEILNNLKMIKYYSWEHPYQNSLVKVRGQEVDMILKIQTLRNVIFSFAMTLSGISAMIAFIILYAIRGRTSSPANIFSSVSSFEILAMLVFFIPQALSTSADMVLGFKRIGALLSASEEQPYEGYKVNDESIEGDAVKIKNATFSWDVFEDESDEEEESPEEKENNKKLSRKEKKKLKKEKKEREEKRKERQLEREQREKQMKELGVSEKGNFVGLNNIDLTIKKGEFVVITGLVGTGKSSLLNAISGFMKCESGEIDINGSLLLCGAPWIQNNTIRENIIFGLDFDQKFYDEIIRACALHIDLDNLQGSDFTEVGEKGITLSGGQKARINLARAIYANKDIILMDDVLSAVDARVGKHILNHCFLGLLKDKTRILATHQLALIGQADRIIFLNGDGSIDSGNMNDLLLRNENFKKLMQFSKLEETEEEHDMEVEEIIDEKALTTDYSNEKVITTQFDEEEIDYNVNKDASKGKLIKEEERAVNRIKNEVYKNYVKYGAGKITPWGFVPIFSLLLAIATFCDIFTNTWLSFWIGHKFEGRSDGFYIGLYVMFNCLWVIFLTITFVYLITMTTISSKNLNLMAMNRILYAPMSFMDTTPMGRIINRFTKDTDALDNEISENMRFMFQAIAKMIGVFILFIIYIPWVAIAIPFVLFIFFLVANYYQASNREVKRLEAILRSHVYNNVNEMLNGMNTIKAYKNVDRFATISNKLLDQANEATFVVYANQRWIGIQLDILAECVVLLVALLCSMKVFSISPASVGLLLTYSLQMAGELTNLIRTFTAVENDMNSAERVSHYALRLDQEAPYLVDSTKPKDSWPSQGVIKFDNVKMSYRPELPLVLKGLSFDVASNEKIGICGRTGAGKSSIMTALYRIAELTSGKIVIDDVDISEIGLKDLRSKLSIIPQDPVLFNGTIRSNLDPFNEHSDEELWGSLRRSGILTKDEVEKAKHMTKKDSKNVDNEKDQEQLNKFHLDQTVENEGENFSLGERQLISFARALVRESKILILDEATSSVDYETDSKIQTTIAKEFSNCTILCIAHRLKTIINYDKILLLDKGEVKEFDKPWNLFKNKDSVFREMCDKSNIVAEDFGQP